MNITQLIDCHVHTRRSFDGSACVGRLLDRAKQLGLRGFCITDHCEINEKGHSRLWSYRRLDGSFRDAVKAAENKSGIKVLRGLELGQPAHNPALAQKVLDRHDYDFVLASVHYLRDGRDFYDLDYTRPDCDAHEVYEKYLDELMETVEWGQFDSLAHLTYPLRYIIGRDHIDFDQSRYQKKYDEILSLLAQKGKALEINTSGKRRENGFLLPDSGLVKRFFELGGKYITLGSDSHREAHLGTGLTDGAKAAKEAGFDCAVYYEKHRPQSISLD